jgi:glycosyl transferase family 25
MQPSNVKIYVLTVKTFEDRIRSIREQSKNLGFDFEFVYDYDASELQENDLIRFDQSSLTIPAISLIYKHLEAEKRFLDSNFEYLLVLEDDAILVKDFFHRLKNIISQLQGHAPGVLIFFGGSDNYVDSRFANCLKNQIIPKKISTTEGYLTDRSACEQRLKYISQLKKISLGADHLLKHVDSEQGIQHYWVCEPMVYQGSLTGRFKTVLDASRSKYPSFFIYLRFHYNRIRRNLLRRYAYKIFRSKK